MYAGSALLGTHLCSSFTQRSEVNVLPFGGFVKDTALVQHINA